MRYISDPEFLEWARPLIISRNRYSEDEKGRCRNIMNSVSRLMNTGLVSERDIDGALFRWEKGMRKDVFGRCSQTRIVSISDRLDSEHVRDDFVDGIVYHQCLHLRQLVECKWVKHDREFRQYMTLFPDSGMAYNTRSKDYQPIRDPRDPYPPLTKHIVRPLETFLR